MKTAINHTLDMYGLLAGFIQPGQTEKEIAAYTRGEIESRGLGYAWDPTHCPAGLPVRTLPAPITSRPTAWWNVATS